MLANCGLPTSDDVSESSGFQIVIAPQVAEQCTVGNQGDGTFPANVNRFVMKMIGTNVYFRAEVRQEDLDSAGEVLIQNVPPGDNLTLDLYGCTEDNELSWSARAINVSVTKSHKTSPSFYLTQKNLFNCPGKTLETVFDWRSDLGRGHAFGAAVRTANNGVIITGGFHTATLSTSELMLNTDPTGTDTIIEYQATKGLFRTWDNTLNNPRGLHHAVAYDAGTKILISGGVKSADVRAIPSAPVLPTRANNTDSYDPSVLPDSMFEVIDLATKTVTDVQIANTAGKVLPLNAMSPVASDGALVLSGGMQSNGEPANHVVYIPALPSAVGQIKDVTALTGQLQQPRMGHSMIALGPNDRSIFVLGGNFDPEGEGAGANLAEMIALPATTTGSPFLETFPIQNIPNPDATNNSTAFHEVVLLEEDTVECTAKLLVSGGLNIKKSTTQQYQYMAPPVRLDIIVVSNVCQPSNVSMVVLPQVIIGQPWLFSDPERTKRALHSLTDLGGGALLLGGGFQNMSESNSIFCDASETNGCFYADAIDLRYTFGDLSVINHQQPELTYSHARMGHENIVLSDGTLLVMGGLRCIDNSDCLESDAEIFNPERPAEEDICTPAVSDSL